MPVMRRHARRGRGALGAGRRCRSCEARDRPDRGRVDEGLAASPVDGSPPPPVDLAVEAGPIDPSDELDLPIGEAGAAAGAAVGLTRRPRLRSARASRPPYDRSLPVTATDGLHQTPHYLELRALLVLDERDDLVDELLDLYTPWNLYALHAIGSKIDSELRAHPRHR